ncbi:MAG: hypothetical protein KKH94_05255 [Candidatus Omnitrophica bacterium]|nr:hypothetical protein [Candidatus Omnitrophota bacterium]
MFDGFSGIMLRAVILFQQELCLVKSLLINQRFPDRLRCPVFAVLGKFLLVLICPPLVDLFNSDISIICQYTMNRTIYEFAGRRVFASA